MAKNRRLGKFRLVFEGAYEFPPNLGWTKANIRETLLEYLEEDLQELAKSRKALKKAVKIEIEEIKTNG